MISRNPVCSREDRKALEFVPWEKRSPGVLSRALKCDGYVLTERKWECQDCKSTTNIDFMVQDHLWDTVCPEDGFLCWACFEKRLGRPLTFDDLHPTAPIYSLIRHIYSPESSLS